MNSIKRCSRCILPNTLPSITFDEKGICNHCKKYQEDFENWDLIQERKEKELKKIFETAKTLKHPYDCLVPLSGGKDSTYALYLATKVYKLKTLAITFDNGYLTGLAKENVRNAILSSNADHIFYTLNKENTSKLFKVFVEQTGDFCNACMRGINYCIEFATKSFNIPLVIKGSGRRVQYISQIKELSSLNTPAYFENVIKKTSAHKSFRYLSKHKFSLEIQKIVGGITDILGIQRTNLMHFFTQHIGLYDYVYKPYPEIIELIKKSMNWSDGAGKAEHLDCELHDVPFFMNTLKLPNITKNTFYYSGLIRQGILSREVALKKEEEEYEKTEPPKELLKFLKDNKMSYENYLDYVTKSNKSNFESKLQKKARSIYHRFRKF